MEETYVPRREFHRKTIDKAPKRNPPRRSYGTRPKKETSVKLADVILMQGIVCTLLFAIIVCIRVINTEFTIEIREKLKTALSEQITLDDAANLIDEGKDKLTSLQQTVKTTFGFQDNLTPDTLENETDIVDEQPSINQIENTEAISNDIMPTVTDDIHISETTTDQAAVIADEAIIDEDILYQINSEMNDTATEKKLEPLKEIMPPAEGI